MSNEKRRPDPDVNSIILGDDYDSDESLPMDEDENEDLGLPEGGDGIDNPDTDGPFPIPAGESRINSLEEPTSDHEPIGDVDDSQEQITGK